MDNWAVAGVLGNMMGKNIQKPNTKSLVKNLTFRKKLTSYEL